jgi:hypothetical protein
VKCLILAKKIRNLNDIAKYHLEEEFFDSTTK